MSKYNQIIKSNKVSPENLRLLYEELRLMRNSAYLEKHEKTCIEVISLVVEYIIHGDKNNPLIFDTFCEYNFMGEFIYLSSLKSRNISCEIIRNFALLVLNVSNQTTLYFIFSNNFINQIINQEYDTYDDEFIAYYINFIKSLSQKIDQNTIQFFYQEQHNSFQLLQCAIKYYNHHDSMIKTTVRNIILTFLKLRYEPLYHYFTSLPTIFYFPYIVCVLRDQIIKLSQEMINEDYKRLNDLNDDILDLIMYLQDIYSLKIEKINTVLSNCLFFYLICPLVLESITSQGKPVITLSISIYILILMFKYIKDEAFINVLFVLSFGEKLSNEFDTFFKVKPINPYHQLFESNKSQHLYEESFSSYITGNFSENFIKSTIFQTNSCYPEIIAISKKYEMSSEDILEGEIYKHVLEDLLSKFESSEFDELINYHSQISISTGVNLGLKLRDHTQFSFLTKFRNFINQLNSGKIDDMKNNECRENLLCFLKSKDDSLILLVSILIHVIHRSNISKEILSFGKLLQGRFLMISELEESKVLNEIFGNSSLQEKSPFIKSKDNNSNQMIEEELEKSNIEDEKVIFNRHSLENIVNRNTEFSKIQTHELQIFDNEFFNNSMKNVNTQRSYDSVLVDDLIKLLKVEPAFRTITMRTLIENLESLVWNYEISKSHLIEINKIYFYYLSSVKAYIDTNKQISENAYEIFESEWIEYKKDLNLIIAPIISRPYLMIPFNLEDSVQEYPDILKSRKTEVENFKNSLLIVMQLIDLRSKLYLSNELIKDKFPLQSGAISYEINHSINLPECDFELYHCKAKFGPTKSYTQYWLMLDPSWIMFAIQDPNKNDFVIIKHKYPMRGLECQIDRFDPKLLNILVKSKQEFIDFTLQFEDVSQAGIVSEQLQDLSKSIMNTEFILISSYFDNLLNKWSSECV